MDALRRLLEILSPAEKKRLRRVFLLATVTAILQTLSVLSVMPFMAAAANPEVFQEYAGPHLMPLAGAVVLALVIAANASAAASLRQIHLTAWNINHYLSRRLLAAYLSRPYIWFLDRHSTGLNRNLLDEVRVSVQSVLIPLLYAGVRGMAALLLVLLLLAVDYRLALIFGGVLSGAYLLIYIGLRPVQDRLGQTRSQAVGARMRVAGDAMSGIKEIKSFGAEAEFVKRLEETGPPFVRATAWGFVLAEVPRYLLEVISVGTGLAILVYLLNSGQSLQGILPILTLFAFAGYKLVPNFHQVFYGASQARFNIPALRRLQDDLTAQIAEEAAGNVDPLRLCRGLELDGITFAYPGAKAPSLQCISLTICRGERIGVVGPTGSGKTTLGDILLGLLKPAHGEIRVDGLALTGEAWNRWRASVGYVPQSIFLSDDTVEANIAFGVAPGAIDRDRVASAARMAELDAFVQTLPQRYATPIGERGVRLSGGERQRIGIARALYREPSLLLLDEATSALDSATEEAVMDAVFRLGPDRTVVIIAHRLSTLRHCDRIVVVERGRLAAAGTWEELLQTSDLFRALTRLDARY